MNDVCHFQAEVINWQYCLCLLLLLQPLWKHRLMLRCHNIKQSGMRRQLVEKSCPGHSPITIEDFTGARNKNVHFRGKTEIVNIQ